MYKRFLIIFIVSIVIFITLTVSFKIFFSSTPQEAKKEEIKKELTEEERLLQEKLDESDKQREEYFDTNKDAEIKSPEDLLKESDDLKKETVPSHEAINRLLQESDDIKGSSK